jgi:hypothetical protein
MIREQKEQYALDLYQKGETVREIAQMTCMSEYFYHIRPATLMVEVSRHINPQILVEIEADAVSPQTPK